MPTKKKSNLQQASHQAQVKNKHIKQLMPQKINATQATMM
jgi:hypothetical protein